VPGDGGITAELAFLTRLILVGVAVLVVDDYDYE